VARFAAWCRRLAAALLIAVLVLAAGARGALAGAASAVSVGGATWYVSSLPGSVAFVVSRPAIALTVTVPGSGLPVITGTVSAGGTSVPVALLRQTNLPSAVALTYGEDSLTLPATGRATITLTAGGAQLASQSFSFTVAAGSPPAAPAPTSAEAAFIAELNAFRAQVGAPPVAVSPALTAAARAHAAFVSAQSARYGAGVSVHDEPTAWRTLPGWTGLYARDRDLAFGAATGGGVEVMSSGNADPVAFLVAETVFHRGLLLDPAALAAGAAEVGGQFVLDLSDWGAGIGAPPVVWPPAAATDVPLTFGGEWPSPLAPFPGLSFPAGTPVTWEDYAAPAGTQVLSATFTLTAQPGGQPVAGSVLTPSLWQPYTGSGVSLGTGIAFIPARPLAPGQIYSATVAVQERLADGSVRPLGQSWSFTTGHGSVEAPAGVAQAASVGVAPTASQDPWSAIPSATRARLAALAQAARSGAPPTYSDLYLAPWAGPAILDLSAAGVLHGIGQGMFDPEDPLTTAQLAAALTDFVPTSATAPLANAAALPAWALQPAERAVGAGWLDAAGGVFPADAWATRATAVRALTRMLGWSAAAAAYAAAGGSWPAGIQGDPGPGGEAETDLMWVAHIGLVDGVDGQAAGNQALTRAQLAELLWRILQKAGG
jgi:hypothetical protein